MPTFLIVTLSHRHTIAWKCVGVPADAVDGIERVHADMEQEGKAEKKQLLFLCQFKENFLSLHNNLTEKQTFINRTPP